MAITTKAVALAQKYPVHTLAIVAVFFFGAIFVGAAAFVGIRYHFQDRKLEKLEKKTDQAVEQKDLNVRDANAAGQERKIEDAVRERTIKPEIERTAKNLEEARSRTQGARNDYEEAKKHSLGNDPLDADARALHDRNCADLRDLYPNEPLPGCQP